MRVAAVVVTHNRPKLLAEVLDALRSQTRRPDSIIVVDNASGHETTALLSSCEDIDVLRLEQNVGGAGGFSVGVRQAVSLGFDWILLLDDDAVPRRDCLAQLLECMDHVGARAGAICTTVIEFGGRALMHRRRFDAATLAEPVLPEAAYEAPVTEIDTGSFVGFMLRRSAALEVGVPDASFFLAYDDTEYSLRLKRAGWTIWLAPSAVVDHKRPAGGRLRNGPYSLKHYYNLRNQLAVFRVYGNAPSWRMWAPLFKHGAVAVKDLRWASVKLFLKAWRDSWNMMRGR
ncbi:glycosyl transferase family 2 [Burkholderia ubonensis]|uniref:glycosyltransferase n=1 Tax=Burkholderia ubonensis TaxID=101571 RepID=UPI00075746F4|nr:glycosyltransferase [Burkholderia ubonensis]KVN81193.1 glycosyl transferase family 2 [Burkholderia ubonensis]KVO09710.1 glycosyl transferase family 2 [Burkholderia ubonensis]KVQ69439.1 glycosyl transferase family 2 [Burkholderia ubonensis]